MIDLNGIGEWGSFSLDEAPAPLPAPPAPATVGGGPPPMAAPRPAAPQQQQAPPMMMPMQMPMQGQAPGSMQGQAPRPQPGPPPAPAVLPGGVFQPPTLLAPDAGWSLGVPLAPPQMQLQGMGAMPPPVGMEGHMLGLSLLLGGLGAALGLYYGGAFGGAAGALLGGGAVNVVRAMRYAMIGQPEADREALISGTYAVLSLGAGGYLAWRVADRKPSHHHQLSRAA